MSKNRVGNFNNNSANQDFGDRKEVLAFLSKQMNAMPRRFGISDNIVTNQDDYEKMDIVTKLLDIVADKCGDHQIFKLSQNLEKLDQDSLNAKLGDSNKVNISSLKNAIANSFVDNHFYVRGDGFKYYNPNIKLSGASLEKFQSVAKSQAKPKNALIDGFDSISKAESSNKADSVSEVTSFDDNKRGVDDVTFSIDSSSKLDPKDDDKKAVKFDLFTVKSSSKFLNSVRPREVDEILGLLHKNGIFDVAIISDKKGIEEFNKYIEGTSLSEGVVLLDRDQGLPKELGDLSAKIEFEPNSVIPGSAKKDIKLSLNPNRCNSEVIATEIRKDFPDIRKIEPTTNNLPLSKAVDSNELPSKSPSVPGSSYRSGINSNIYR